MNTATAPVATNRSIVVIDPKLVSYSGHHFTWFKAISEFCKKAGLAFSGYANEKCLQEIVHGIPVKPCLPHASIKMHLNIRILGPLVATSFAIADFSPPSRRWI